MVISSWRDAGATFPPISSGPARWSKYGGGPGKWETAYQTAPHRRGDGHGHGFLRKVHGGASRERVWHHARKRSPQDSSLLAAGSRDRLGPDRDWAARVFHDGRGRRGRHRQHSESQGNTADDGAP